MSYDARWLRRMTEEVAREPVPEVDWDAVEQRVFDRIENDAAPKRLVTSPPAWHGLASVAAAAALIAIGSAAIFSQSEPIERKASAGPLVSASQLSDGQPLASSSFAEGAVLLADGADMIVQHRGWATWRVTSGSRVRVLSRGDTVALELLEGRVEASVVPQPRVDAFTVRAGNTRVAVHGTVFAVERHDASITVSVERGSVAVGPATRSNVTEGWLVVAPGQATFSTDGAKSARYAVNPPAPIARLDGHSDPAGDEGIAADPADVSAAPDEEAADPAPPTRPHVTPPIKDASLPEMLTPALAAGTLGSLRQQIETCYRGSAPPSTSDVTRRVQTTVRITVAPDGHVLFGVFDPPLTPRAQVCASGVVAAAKFPKSRVESNQVLELQF